MSFVIYLDHNATTPILPEVLEVMMPYLTTEWGNPSSSYKFGSKLKSVVETAREQVAELIGAHPLDVIFTSCGTESNNTAIAAALKANPAMRHIVTSQVEHSSVLNYCMALERGGLCSGGFTPPFAAVDVARASRPPSRERPAPAARGQDAHATAGGTPALQERGYRVTYLPVDREGLLNLADLEAAITDETGVVSLMWANNETGVLFPVERIAEICHCDAVQAAGKVEIDVRKIPADYLSLTGHKFHAPKGIGALYVRRKSPFSPLVYGGHRERNRRGGTESGPLVVGMGKGQLREATPLNNRLTHKRKRGRARRIPGMTQVSKGVPSV
ncbi:MAG: aminotransferase class V-fold PLP-dependent enzyme [Terriglobia bacterium]|jgi:cysteine desulfurase